MDYKNMTLSEVQEMCRNTNCYGNAAKDNCMEAMPCPFLSRGEVWVRCMFTTTPEHWELRPTFNIPEDVKNAIKLLMPEAKYIARDAFDGAICTCEERPVRRGRWWEAEECEEDYATLTNTPILPSLTWETGYVDIDTGEVFDALDSSGYA